MQPSYIQNGHQTYRYPSSPPIIKQGVRKFKIHFVRSEKLDPAHPTAFN